ncbi:conserved hypothetical protein [Hyphomicrobiales bacterium]|nr:conserved hypothetical protein [Hyphomicrobiales bacterium]CAH1698784.1 conserved hypothetical protein [Hyphomicrobiales bacterium]CAI0342431.1 conserved hypothetical protein [Hyphomicrobiales bacterium]
MGRINAKLAGWLSSGSTPALRRILTLGLACVALVVTVRSTDKAAAFGDTRTITIRHMHTKEETTVTFKRDGRYDSSGLEKLNWALRDWRTDEPTRMDPRLFDVVWEVQRQLGSDQPFHVVSSYRAPGTNAMLRRRSRAVAKHSQHMLGKAMDFYLPDVPTARIREIGMRLQRGGVGFYPNAHTPFVHLDVGSVRSWPRMTRDQLVRLFPDEKTVHLPADGQPLAGYELAKADILSGGGAVAGYAAADFDEGAVMASGRKSFWAALFGGDDEEADARPAARGRRNAPRPQPAVMVYANAGAGYVDSNSGDGGRFAVAAAPEPSTRALTRERSERLAPQVTAAAAPAAATAPQAQAEPVPATPPQRAVQESRPQLIDAPLPLARPRGLALPADEPVQIAALPASGGALAFAPQAGPAADQRLVLASLPPRRPDEMVTATGVALAGSPINAPLPPIRPTALADAAIASLRGTGSPDQAPATAPEGRLVTAALPPIRPREGGTTFVAASQRSVPVVEEPEEPEDMDRSGLKSLFATVARTGVSTGKPVNVATARAKTASPSAAPIAGPSPAAALGFSHADSGAPRPGTFSGPAVRPLPTSFVQN